MVTGGTDATITPAVMQGFCVMQVVTTSRNDEPAKASRPFDRGRDGFVLGEGAWILIFEERELALARGARSTPRFWVMARPVMPITACASIPRQRSPLAP